MQDLLMCSPVLATIIKPILPVVKTLMTSFSLRIFCYSFNVYNEQVKLCVRDFEALSDSPVFVLSDF